MIKIPFKCKSLSSDGHLKSTVITGNYCCAILGILPISKISGMTNYIIIVFSV